MNKTDILNEKGEKALQSGDLTTAMEIFSLQHRRHPTNIHALNCLGIVHAKQGSFSLASKRFKQALALQPDALRAAGILVNLGRMKMAQQHFTEAADSFQQAIRLQPEFSDARYHLGRLLCTHGRYREALNELELAASSNTTDSNVLGLLGTTRLRLGNFDGAKSAFRQAMHLDPESTDVLGNLASLLWSLGHLAEARALYALGLHHHPEDPMLHHGMGSIWSAIGHVEKGWHEQRWLYHPEAKAPDVTKFGGVLPIWDGSNLGDHKLLIYADQGLGDTIQYLRFVPLLINTTNAEVIVWVPPGLSELFIPLNGVCEWRSSETFSEAASGCSAMLPMGAIPAHLELSRADIKTPYPIPAIPHESLTDWENWVDQRAQSRLKVGIVWQGNIEHGQDVFRSIPVTTLKPLAGLEAIAWFNLQVPDQRRPGTETILPFETEDAAPRLTSWSETASALVSLDLLLTADTGIAHLAGMLGIPTWLMLAHVPDSRWQLEGDSTAWYPSMRLFRQPSVGDWPAVIEQVQKALQIELRNL